MSNHKGHFEILYLTCGNEFSISPYKKIILYPQQNLCIHRIKSFQYKIDKLLTKLNVKSNRHQ